MSRRCVEESMLITSTQQLTEGKRQHLTVHVQQHLHCTHTHRERSTGLWLVICSPPIMTLIYLSENKSHFTSLFHLSALHELVLHNYISALGITEKYKFLHSFIKSKTKQKQFCTPQTICDFHNAVELVFASEGQVD